MRKPSNLEGKSRMKPWLYLPSHWSYSLSPLLFNYVGRHNRSLSLHWSPFEWNELKFSSPLGIAAGLDKNADYIQTWWNIGSSFVEIGTVTPEPQLANPRPVIKKNIQKMSLWNSLGFPSKGANYVFKKLSKISKPYFTPVFMNIGKNRDTPNHLGYRDYIFLMKKFSPMVDLFVINISSPNTPELRKLLEPKNLKPFLQSILENKQKKIILKLSPDISTEELGAILDISIEYEIDGWIFTNTTTCFPPTLGFPKDKGGVSGKFLSSIATQQLEKAMDFLKDQSQGKLIISTGGIFSTKDIKKRLELGANLLQCYSALVFNGLNFFKMTKKNILM